MKNKDESTQRRSSRQMNEEFLDLTNHALGKKYVIFDLIRKNEHCYIYKGIDKETREERTFKFYNLREIQAQRSFKQKQIDKRISKLEYEVSHKCKSMNILKCFDIYEDQSYKVLVYEFCNMGSLKDEIRKRTFKSIDEIRAIIILKQIISALKSLHENHQILHKNLKSNKILISNGVYKITDFGFPKVMYPEDKFQNANFIVPEIIKEHYYDSKVQVWSLGALFHEILLGRLPTACLSRANLFGQTNKNTSTSAMDKAALQAQNYSAEVIDFVQKCLMFDPVARMSWLQLEQHPMLLKSCITVEKPIISQIQQIRRQKYISTLLSIEDEAEGKEKFDDDLFYFKRFNLEKQRRQILRQIEKPYVRHGLPFTIQKLDNALISTLQQGVSKDEENLYIAAKQYYQNSLRVDFVLKQIIQPIINMLGEACREEIQFIYLLICRCFSQISKMNHQIRGQSQYCCILMKCVKKLTSSVYQQIKALMMSYGEKLTSEQSRWQSVISDRIVSWLYQQETKKRDRFLVGIEVIDYQKDEQIQYTIKRYEEINIKLTSFLQNEENKDQNNRKSIQNLQTYMGIYKQIWESTSHQIEEYPNIKCFIDRVFLNNNR